MESNQENLGRKRMRPRLLDFVEKERPVLQVALDYTNLEEALRLATALRRELGEHAWIAEAGTPLIKTEGMKSVRLLRASIDPVHVIADTKTADTGELEIGLAADAGASAATVLACTLNETIEAAIREAHSRGIALAADMIAVKNIEERAEQLESLGVDIIELHIGIDVQRALGMTAGDLVELVRKLSKRLKPYLAVAGGINKNTAPQLAEAGADIVIVGGAITKSIDPVRAAREIIRAIKRKRQ